MSRFRIQSFSAIYFSTYKALGYQVPNNSFMFPRLRNINPNSVPMSQTLTFPFTYPMVHTYAYPPLPPSNSAGAEGLQRIQEEIIEEESLTRVSIRQSTRSRTTIHSDAFSIWDNELFLKRLRSSMITEIEKISLLDHYHHGESYIKEVCILLPQQKENIW